MKTKLTLILVPLFLLKLTLAAQVWYDDQATWYRFVDDGFTGSKSIIEVKIEKDTIFNGQQVKKLAAFTKFERALTGETEAFINYYYEYESNDSVFHWNGEEFELIYNFNLIVGDTVSYNWSFHDSVHLVLDSIGIQNFSNQPRRIQYFRSLVALNPNLAWCGLPEEYVIIEGIGSLLNRNPRYDFLCATDLPWVSLRCFSDSFSNYNPDKLICDIIDRIVPTFEVATGIDLQVYPNPTTDWLQIKTIAAPPITAAIIYDLLGYKRVVNVYQNRLDVSFLPNGVYFLEVALEGQVFTKKIIKKGN